MDVPAASAAVPMAQSVALPAPHRGTGQPDIEELNNSIRQFIELVIGANLSAGSPGAEDLKSVIVASATMLLAPLKRPSTETLAGLDFSTYTSSELEFNSKMENIYQILLAAEAQGVEVGGTDILNTLKETLARLKTASTRANEEAEVKRKADSRAETGLLGDAPGAKGSLTPRTKATPPVYRYSFEKIPDAGGGAAAVSSSAPSAQAPLTTGTATHRVPEKHQAQNRTIDTSEKDKGRILSNIGHYFQNTESYKGKATKGAKEKERSRGQVRLLFWDLIDLIGTDDKLKKMFGSKGSELKIEPKKGFKDISSNTEIKIAGERVKRAGDEKEGKISSGKLFPSPIKGVKLQEWVRQILRYLAEEEKAGPITGDAMEAFKEKYCIGRIKDMETLCSGEEHSMTVPTQAPAAGSGAPAPAVEAASTKIASFSSSLRTGGERADASAAAHASKSAHHDFPSASTSKAPREDLPFNEEDLKNLNKCIADAYLDCFKDTTKNAAFKAKTIKIHPGKLMRFLNNELSFEDLAFYRMTDDKKLKLFSIDKTFEGLPKEYPVIKASIGEKLKELRKLYRHGMTEDRGAVSVGLGVSHSNRRGDYTYDESTKTFSERACFTGPSSPEVEKRFSAAGGGGLSHRSESQELEGKSPTGFTSSRSHEGVVDRVPENYAPHSTRSVFLGGSHPVVYKSSLEQGGRLHSTSRGVLSPRATYVEPVRRSSSSRRSQHISGDSQSFPLTSHDGSHGYAGGGGSEERRGYGSGLRVDYLGGVSSPRSPSPTTDLQKRGRSVVRVTIPSRGHE